MTTIKTSELSGAALDWAVAKCEKSDWLGNQAEIYVTICGFSPSTNWRQGGPILEREVFAIEPFKGRSNDWRAFDFTGGHVYAGESALIAAMRCYVASKLGESVDVPDELLEVNHE